MNGTEATTGGGGGPRRDRTTSFDLVPRLVFWETTKACPLACVHCRATAQREPAPGELTTDEARTLIDELAGIRAADPGPDADRRRLPAAP